MDNQPVLVVGGTGALGRQVVDELFARGKRVRALVRPGSDASRLERLGAEIARGDMMEPGSLRAAMTGVDAVISTAAGYTGHSKGDSSEIDLAGNRNLAEAAAATGVRRFVLTSILTSDQTPQVPHFWHKKLAEDHLEANDVPFVALRPGAFLDQVSQIGGDGFSKGRLIWVGSPRIPLTFVLTSDLAGYLAAAVEVDLADGERVDIGWQQPVSINDVAAQAGRALGTTVKVRAIPAPLMRAAGRLSGGLAPTVKDMAAMFDWFQTGRYVADTTRQQELFGPPPTAQEAITTLLDQRS